jgi:arsenical pump membrane protein
MHEALGLLVLVSLLTVVVLRPRGVPEVAVAVPGVAVLLAVGAISFAATRAEIEQLGSVVGFLAAVLVLADGCDGEGVFRAAGGLMARFAGRSPSRLLLAVVAASAVTTALLSLDTTVVLLTPVVVATVRLSRARPRPSLYGTVHLANSASLLLPVSNLTNLLAIAVVPVSFTRFAALMAVPWLVAILVETVGLRGVFRGDFAGDLSPALERAEPVPRFATTVLVVTVIGFAVGSLFGVAPVWVATAGAVVLAVRRLVAHRTTPLAVFASAAPSFCLFVLGLGVVVVAVSQDGLGSVIDAAVPSGSSLPALLGVAAVSAVMANLINNLPATLLLLPVVAVGGSAGVGPALAMLIGVNIGPNVTYPGSLATLLWRRVVADVDGVPTLRDFTSLGVATAPIAILGSTLALWVSLRVIGAS